MNVVPKNFSDKITFFQTHLESWSENAVEIGTSPERVALLAEKTAAAREALAAQQEAYNAARGATLTLKQAIEEMATVGSTIILQIKGQAGMVGNEIYPLASIAPPRKKSPQPAPGKPTGFTVALQGDGSLLLKWKCPNPRGSKGTIYRISRQDGVGTPYQFLDVVGEKRFVDITVPRGTSEIIYQIQAVRSKAIGPVASFSVSIGGGLKPMYRVAA